MPHTCKHDAETLRTLQALPLRQKVFETRQRIAEWVKHWGEDGVYVAFSGGKDSTVLLDIVRRDYPDVPAVFCDTGLEFPEIRDFVKTFDNVTWLKPKMTFKAVIEKYGFPFPSKTQACAISRYIRTKDPVQKHRRLNGWPGGKKGMISKKWQYLIHAPFECSDQCCYVMKEAPIKKYNKLGRHASINGVMADESNRRSRDYVSYGCNAFDRGAGGPQSRPIMFWSTDDIWSYLRERDLKYCSVYDMGYKRTGCMFCAFGVNYDNTPNRFQRMQRTHPKQWKYCMDKLGMREVLEYCGIHVEDKQLKLDLGD